MHIIPVIDLKEGHVVHARRGERAGYQPIRSALAAGSAPVAIVAGLLDLFPFRELYIADLDALEKHGDHRAAIGQVRSRFPNLGLWLDAGFATEAEAGRWLGSFPGTVLVLGSEAQRDAGLLTALMRGDEAGRIVLSLDYREEFLGPLALLDSRLWPERVIAMTLKRVGSGEGPDFARLAAVRALAGTRLLYAAGGLRNRDDLLSLARAGAAGVLVASALHDGCLTACDIAAFAPSPP